MTDGGAAPGAQPASQGATRPERGRDGRAPGRPLFGALDLGTNNCRLLVATPAGDSFRVVDAFSRVVRLGEGLAETGSLSGPAMERALGALRICAGKLRRRSVDKARCIATEACRVAHNGADFLARVKAETGLELEVITPLEEANLSVAGCLSLVDRESPVALVVDIGGGSTELSWVDVVELTRREAEGGPGAPPIVGWASAPIGVVTLAERFPEGVDHAAAYDAMKAHTRAVLPDPPEVAHLKPAFASGAAHIVGSSGTITSLASVHLELPRYDRSKVDGVWLTREETVAACLRLKALSREGRAAQPCIGADRADVVLAGCAILEAILELWPTPKLRVADRGLREGMLISLMRDAPRRRRRRRGRRRGSGGGAGAGPSVNGADHG
jgi:exopolyphosphatase/guanosine-5'-triphosphate,3'-diphosphate pyrophosphatase